MKQAISAILISIVIAAGALLTFNLSTTYLTQHRAAVYEQQHEELAPVKILIPQLGISTAVEQVGKDTQGRMDVPKNPDNVAWYQLGPAPGQIGNAVIAGHYDSKIGPAVFFKLKTLQPGDTISVINQKGQVLDFVVIKQEIFPDATFPIPTVFGTSDKPRLNLITCGGVFNKSAQAYNKRVVIFTELK